MVTVFYPHPALRLRRTGLPATETLADLRHKGRGKRNEGENKDERGRRERQGDGLQEKGNGGIIINYG